MTLRLALALTGIVLLLTCVVFGFTVYSLSQPGVTNQEKRVQAVGSGTGAVAGIALAAIWIPFAFAWKKRHDADKKTSKPKKKKKARRVEDDED